MSGHEYLVGVLAKQDLTTAQLNSLRATRDEVESHLRGDFGWAPRFYYGGSFAKNTMLSTSYDLDIILYFPHTETANLGQLFSRVHSRLASKYQVVPRTVALRLPYQGGFHIDVVPGRAQDAPFRYATLYKNTTPSSTLQTSVKVHIEAVKDAGLSDIVRLAKLWRLRWGLDVPTFALEIAVARAMYNVRRADLGEALWTVLGSFATDFAGARFVDPANTNNVIEVASGVRAAVQARAQYCRAQKEWSSVVW